MPTQIFQASYSMLVHDLWQVLDNGRNKHMDL